MMQQKVSVTSEFARSAYQSSCSMMEHFSDLLFKARVASLTAAVAVWGYVLGVTGASLASRVSFFGLTIPSTAIAAYLGCIGFGLFYGIENAVLGRYFDAIRSGREIERDLGAEYYFSMYEPAYLPTLLYQVVNSALLLAFFVVATLWVGVGARSIIMVVGSSILPVIMVYRQFQTVRGLGRRVMLPARPDRTRRSARP